MILSLIYLFSVSDSNYDNDQLILLSLEDDSVAPRSQPVYVLTRSTDFFYIVLKGCRILGKYEQFLLYDLLMGTVNLF